MAQAEIREKLNVDAEKMFQAITRYEDYPQFVDGMTNAKCDRTKSGKVRVVYQINMMKDITYTLDHVEDATKRTVKWTLVESDAFKKNDGCWEIKDLGSGKCEAFYSLDVEFKIPVPGFILNRLVKGSLPSMIKSFEKRARSL